MLSISSKMLLQKIISFIKEHKLIDKSDQVALAISGGKDSVFAAHILNELEISFVMVHVNFCLRGEESVQDALFVSNLSTKLAYCSGVFHKTTDTNLYAQEFGLNIQSAARQIRYDYFQELKDQGIFTKIITAHHGSDHIETFFINLIRGSGVHGLKGIPIQREYVIRPFLNLSSNEIVQYLEDHAISYQEDSSNADTKYLRNKLRNNILPKFTKNLPQFYDGFTESLKLLKKQSDLLNHLLSEQSRRITTKESGTLTINKSQLLSFPQPPDLLYYILDKRGFNYAQCEQIITSCKNHSGAQFRSSKHQLLVGRQSLILTYIVDKHNGQLTINTSGIFRMDHLSLHIIPDNRARFNSNNNEEIVQIPQSFFPLTLRYWRNGDKFQPLGMSGHQLLSDFFINQKIESIEKKNTHVLCSGDTILWIVGHRISNQIKVKSSNDLYQLKAIFQSD